MTRNAKRLLAALVFAGGCTATQTIIDSMNKKPLPATPFHRQLTEKTQCMHCHTEISSAPAVPHPQYKKCASCHTVSD